MAVDFFIPKLGDGVNEATIVDWLVEDGAQVNEGDDLIELETDKAVVPVPANASGTVRLGPFKAGDVVEISTVVAVIGAKDGTFEPSGETAVADTGGDIAEETTPSPETEQSDTPPAESGPKVTPVARKMAADMGVDLTAINGSGELGKITKDDVLHAAEPAKAATTPKPELKPESSAPAQPAAPPKPKPAPASTAAPPAATGDDGDEVLERVPLKGIRGVIARRMAESTQATARVTLVAEVDATELVGLREQLKGRYAEAWGFAPGYNDLLALMVANGLREFPYMNARLSADGEAIEQIKSINVGMAVDTDRGLLVPVIKNADRMGLQEFGQAFREMVGRARDGKSSMDDLSGGTFTITSLGIYRVEAFTPVINLPEAAILGVGRISEKPAVKDGQIAIRKMLTLSLVFDHRLTDGAPAARFLDYLCDLIEEPYLMFLTRK